MSSYCPAVFVASLQCIDEVQVALRGTPGSRVLLNCGFGSWGLPRKIYEEMQGRFLTERHEYLLVLIGRSHFLAQVQAEDRKERRRLD